MFHSNHSFSTAELSTVVPCSVSNTGLLLQASDVNFFINENLLEYISDVHDASWQQCIVGKTISLLGPA